MFILPTLRGSPRRGKQQSPTEQNNRLLLPGIWRVNKPKFLFRFRCSLLRAPLGLMESCEPGLTNWNFVLFCFLSAPSQHTNTRTQKVYNGYPNTRVFLSGPSYPPSQVSLFELPDVGGCHPRWVARSRPLFVPYPADRDGISAIGVCRL